MTEGAVHSAAGSTVYTMPSPSRMKAIVKALEAEKMRQGWQELVFEDWVDRSMVCRRCKLAQSSLCRCDYSRIRGTSIAKCASSGDSGALMRLV